jgi:hypothetical protein
MSGSATVLGLLLGLTAGELLTWLASTPGRSVLAFAVLGMLLPTLFPAAVYAQPVDTARPNVIVILADDLGFGDLLQADRRFATPQIDALRDRGMTA